jgi:hypothetical protein
MPKVDNLGKTVDKLKKTVDQLKKMVDKLAKSVDKQKVASSLPLFQSKTIEI